MTSLIVFAGLPGAGKSAVAQALAQATGAIWLRIDSIEQAIRESRVVNDSLNDAGYRAAYAVADDNLRLGRDVIADSVNPWMLTRNAWRDVGIRAAATVLEIEVICSDVSEHRRRVDTRVTEVAGLDLPDWAAVVGRDYHPWDREHLTIDTFSLSAADGAALVVDALRCREIG